MARFNERPPFPYDFAFVNDVIISTICRNQSKPNRIGKEAWTIHGTPTWSQENMNIEAADATRQLLECAKSLGLDCSDAETTTHCWRYASGSVKPYLE